MKRKYLDSKIDFDRPPAIEGLRAGWSSRLPPVGGCPGGQAGGSKKYKESEKEKIKKE